MVMFFNNKLTGRGVITVLALYGITDVFAIYAVKGSTTQLLCPFTRTASLTWSFKSPTESNFKPYSINERLSVHLSDDLKQRLSVTGDHSIGKYHLNISNIKESDQGIYQCTDTSNSQSSTQDLTVIVGPTAVNLDNVIQDNKIHGIEGQDMTIRCTATGGQPQPDIKLVILGTTYIGKQSRQHTFKPVRANDGSNVTCLAGYEEIKSYPLSTSANIHLDLKPVITPNSPSTLSTEERTSFEVPCQSTGSRPVATMYWLLGQQITNITANASTQSIHDTQEDTYNLTSTLRYRVDRKYNRQTLICRAVNVAGSMDRSITLDVKYAPDVTVQNSTLSQTQSPRQIKSMLDSNPTVNTCKWHHKSKYGEFIRNFSDYNQILTLPTVSDDKEYQDTGEYICTAKNGIKGMNGQLNQNGSGYITSNAPPVITADNKDHSTQYGKFGISAKVYVNTYSIPKYSGFSWYIGNTQLVSNRYVIKDEPAMVKDVFHGVEVQLDGYRVTLTISHLKEPDFTNYTLHLYHGNSLYVHHEVTLESASAPETPSNFSITSSKETSITVQWIPGYDGGQTQTFYIEYRIVGTNVWLPKEIKKSNQLESHNLYTLLGLQDKTSYELRMYAKNKFNQSQHTDTETIITLGKANSTSIGGVIGGVAGGLVAVIAILIIIAFVLFKRKSGSGFPNKKTRSQSDSEVEEGLKDNVLYEGSDTEGLKVNILYQSAGPDSVNQGPNTEYAEVSKPHKKQNKASNDEYAEVQKQNTVYAEVDKKAQQKNVKNKNQKDKKKPPKSGKTKGGALNNNADGEYANSGNPMGNMSDGAYSNAENQSVGNKKNEQGLEYADLAFGSKIPKGKQPVIHGAENRTIYSDVDHTKKAPPPPQESEYEETDIRHGKK